MRKALKMETSAIKTQGIVFVMMVGMDSNVCFVSPDISNLYNIVNMKMLKLKF